MTRHLTAAAAISTLLAIAPPAHAENCNPHWKAPSGARMSLNAGDFGGLYMFGSLDGKYAKTYLSASKNTNLLVWTNANGAVEIWPRNTRRVTLSANGASKTGGGEWGVLSDARLKKNVRDLNIGLSEIEELRPRAYKYAGRTEMTPADGREHIGLVAQEARQVMPFLVKEDTTQLLDGKPVLTVNPSALTYALINAVKEETQMAADTDAQLDALLKTVCMDKRNARACAVRH